MVDSKIIKRTYKTSSIADIARRINNVAFRRYGFTRSEILMHWPEIVGSVLARSSLPERLV
ncbi:MAG: DciA family protein, partial [Emcibacteraceae bacterium]|nr:DciA family protein [Emcibacteraceae bacterium]